MVFNSIVFLLFFVVFYHIYWYVNNRKSIQWRNLVILLGSYIFYGFWDYRFLLLLVISTGIDFISGNNIEQQPKKKKIWLYLSLSANLGILGFFKYFNFFIQSFVDLGTYFGLQLSHAPLSIILPLGISFYTFQSLGYTIDVYRGKIRAEKSILDFAAFITFFPQMIAGPIERASSLLPQFRKRKEWKYTETRDGLQLFLWGLFKKVAIADNTGLLADKLFDSGTEFYGIGGIVGVILFGIQIYADFSGYCDMAIGIAATLGFRLSENFKSPYFAATFSDFWARWHITLSRWFKEYVYIPLGGNRQGRYKTFFNILITFLLSGLWHGAAYTFLLWGFLHGVMLILEKILAKGSTNYGGIVVPLAILLWLPFRAEDIGQVSDIFMDSLTFHASYFSHLVTVVDDMASLKLIILGLGISLLFGIDYKIRNKGFNSWVNQRTTLVKVLFVWTLITLIFLLVNLQIEPTYIYFQF